MNLPPDKAQLLDRIAARLSSLPGVAAVALGGSYARGTQRPGSDLDVAIYYEEAAPFSIQDIRQVAAEISVQGPPDVTDFYGWGAWVNGGAWVHTGVCKVDFLYRNLDQVQRTLTEAAQGTVQLDYAQQPPFGFPSVIYLAETHVCVPLWDPGSRLAHLKAQVAAYPPALKERWTASTLWLAEFSLLHADGYSASGDVYAVAGTLARAAFFTVQALFALNETYFISDKTAMKEVAAFLLAPPHFVERLNDILANVGRTPETLSAATGELRRLWSDVVALTDGSYQPAFRL